MSGWSPWARRAIRRIRPHRPHWRSGRSAQRAQSGRRSQSRPATGLTIPQRPHASASSRRRQRAQTPPSVGDRVSGRSARPQRAQLGAGSDRAPWARSACTSWPTAGGAPTASARGSAVNAVAKLRSAAGCAASAANAVWTCLVVTVGSAASTAATTCRRRCSPITDTGTSPSPSPLGLLRRYWRDAGPPRPGRRCRGRRAAAHGRRPAGVGLDQLSR